MAEKVPKCIYCQSLDITPYKTSPRNEAFVVALCNTCGKEADYDFPDGLCFDA